MYEVKFIHEDETTENTLYTPGSNTYCLLSAKLKLECGKAGELTLEVPDVNPAKADFVCLTDEILVYRDGEELWRGRAITREEDFYKTGTLTCEGVLAYLYDTYYPPFEFSGSPADFLAAVLDNHNAQVEERKRIYLGNVTVEDNNDYIARSSIEYNRTLTVLTDKLINDSLGGYFRVRIEDGIKYLDYLASYDTTATQPVAFGENLLNLAQNVEYSDLATVILPLGAKLEDSDGNQTDEYLTIADVNGGSIYYADEAAVAEYGWIVVCNIWDDVTEASNLLTKAKNYLAQVTSAVSSFEVNAVDLALISSDYAPINLGDMVLIRSEPHGVNQYVELTSLTIDLLDPSNDTLTFGADTATLTDSQRSSSRSVQAALESLSVRYANLVATVITTDYLTANYITANDIAAKYVTTDTLTANYVKTSYLTANYITASDIAAKYVTTDTLTANYITAMDIAAKYVTTNTLTANYITASDINAKYATIDLANVSVESVGTLFANVGLLTNMTVVDGSVTGTLNGVTINADVITTGTLSVDRLLLTGEGGIVYAINASSSGLTETELSEEQYQNYINGTCIVAQSITANQIAAETITGDKIAANTITASNLAVTELSAITGNVGELTSGILKSQNYDADEGTGLLIDLNTGTIYYDALTAISTSVSDNTLAINKLTSTANSLVASVSALSVGGRNYALTSGNYTEDSDLSNWVWYPTDYSANVSLTACDGYVRLEKINSSSGIYGLWLKLSDAVDFQADEKYTITVKYRLSADWEIVLYAGSVLADGGLSLTSLGSSIGDGDGVGEWAVASFTGVPYDYYSSDAVTRYIGFYIPNLENGETFDIAYIKFEKGTMSTDWTPAPEDTDSAVEAVSASLALTIEDETGSDGETTHVAKLSANADRIELTSGQLVISSDNFSLAADGTIVATNGTFTGKITATSGTIGGFTIGSSAIYNSKTSLSSTTSGVYVGTDGISLGSTFSVTKAGVITAKSGTIGPLTISNSSNTDANSGHTYASSLFVQQYGTSVTVWDATTDDSTVSTTVDAEFGIKATGSSLTALNQYLIWKKSGDAWSNAIIPYSVTGWGKVKCSGIDIYPTRAIYADGDGDLTYCDSELRCIYTGTYYAYLNLCKIVNDIDPASTNTYDFGGSSYRYRRIYVNTVYRSSEESLSDRKLKQNVKPLTEDYEQLIMGLNAVEYDFINGDSHRKHMGFIAQDVRDTALATVGDLSLFSASVIGDDHAEYSEELPDEQLQWYLSYEELIAPLVAMVQHQQRRIERLEAALAAITKEESSC